MKSIALVGPYNAKTRSALYEHVPEGFSLFDVPTPEAYPALEKADYIIIRTLKLAGSDLLRAKSLRFIQKWGAGYDNLDIPSISELGIPAASCVGVNSGAVAEMAVLHMLAVYRNLLIVNSRLKKGIWAKDEIVGRSYLLFDKLVGIVGMGSIGSRVAHIVQGFGARVQYHDVQRLSPEREKELGVTYVPFDQLLASSDIVSIHVPLRDETRMMFGAREFGLMKPTSVFINTARGGVVDEQALYAAVREERLLGAGLDAFSQEPITPDNPLLALENVVMTPHSGGNTTDNDIHMIRRCYGNITNVDAGLPIDRRDVINNQLIANKLKVRD